MQNQSPASFVSPTNRESITLGGGRFRCTEAVFVQVRGVTDVESGYCNGVTSQPSYEAVCSGQTGHAEVVKLEFDPAEISLREILEIFFVIHDPATLNQQGHDVATQYCSGIYTHSPAQQEVAQAVIREIAASKTRVDQGDITPRRVRELVRLIHVFDANFWMIERRIRLLPNALGSRVAAVDPVIALDVQVRFSDPTSRTPTHRSPHRRRHVDACHP